MRILEVDAFGPMSATFTLHRGEILGIAGLLGAGRTRLLRSIFGLEHVRTGRVQVGAWTGRPSPASQLAHGIGMLSEDRKGEGLAVSLPVADNLTLSRLEGLGPGPIVLPSRQDEVGADVDRAAWRSDAADRGSPSASCPAATSRRLRSRGCSITTSTCCCSTSRRAASMSAARRRSTRCSTRSSRTRQQRPRGSAARQQLPAGAARPLRSHRRHASRPPRTSTRAAAGLTEHQLMMDATGAEHAA